MACKILQLHVNMGDLKITKMHSYHKYDPAPSCNPLIYPGSRPPFSYVLYGDDVYSLNKCGDDILDKILKASELQTNELTAVLGYGSNINPAQLRKKFKNNKIPLIVLLGTLENHDVAYMSKITRYGAIPAALVYSPGSVVDIGINLLNSTQLEIMNKSEKGYDPLSLNTQVKLTDLPESIDVTYYHTDKLLSSVDGYPVCLTDVSARRRFYSEMTEFEILDYVAKKFNFENKEIMIHHVKTSNNTRYRINKYLLTQSISSNINTDA